jgi:hypothetical protein
MDTDLIIYAKGEAFENGIYDLRSLDLLFSSYRSILDRLVAVQLGRRQLSAPTKRQLNYDVKIQEGSIELLIDFALEHPEMLAIFSQDGGYQLSTALTKLFRDAISLRVAAAKFIEKGQIFNININNSFNWGSRNNNIAINGSNITIPDPKILFAAQATRFSTDKLLRNIDGKNIKKVNITSPEETFTLDDSKKIILGRDKQILPASLKIVGRLDMVAFSSHRGVIISNNESFPVTWDEKNRTKMQKFADKKDVLFTVNPVIDHSRLDNNAIGFHVLNCEQPQTIMDI